MPYYTLHLTTLYVLRLFDEQKIKGHFNNIFKLIFLPPPTIYMGVHVCKFDFFRDIGTIGNRRNFSFNAQCPIYWRFIFWFQINIYARYNSYVKIFVFIEYARLFEVINSRPATNTAVNWKLNYRKIWILNYFLRHPRKR